ncbi:MATE family efflux transporter [Brochothrix thermosphacta]|uniref:MATE family efflux transporter n=1 Tax=Brochothrix thermosphacta TaxID=2756 RepID=UPI00083FA04F|nr:MATE family efflux transporter [Brochothrix thermosphacta]ANZ95578.1 hypothetical protein BFC19_09405 [Brochothrix thermosphacta]ANZ98372.1 hypothetical protein BFC20_12000 [Brochothrix thermosphacta]MDO7863721.1 MATE family efflux transporter [Brochothrix thermosphacta]ODJ51595.1 hypothetical protein BFR40_06190 [Brochothrix thermosphacta]ODJ54520.1 hypothetical protein BFR41_08385 [Brochothrix thermosphacta]
MNKLDAMKDKNPLLVFAKYAIPSMFGMMLMAINVVMDGVFVGHALGATALAAVNIVIPVYSFYVAMSLWIGVGATTRYSQAMGEGDRKKAQTIFTQAVFLIVSISIVVSSTLGLLGDNLLSWLGANAEITPMASEYLHIFLLFGFVLTLENMLSLFVRNDGSPMLAMIALIVTAVVNIGLNYYFLIVLKWGIMSAALGLIISAAVGILVLLTHFVHKSNNLKFNFKFKGNWYLKSFFYIGFPSFLAEMGISVFTIAYNIAIVSAAGTMGAAAFSIVNYTHSIALLLFLGLSSATQPLISYYQGAKMYKEQKAIVKYGITSSVIIGLVIIVIGQVFTTQIISLFGSFTPELIALGTESIRIFFFAYLFMGTNFVLITFMQTSGHVNFAIFITAIREFVLVIIFLLVLTPLLGTVGVWLAVPIAEFIICILLSVYFIFIKRKDKLTAL